MPLLTIICLLSSVASREMGIPDMAQAEAANDDQANIHSGPDGSGFISLHDRICAGSVASNPGTRHNANHYY
jgi:hypothetical protein